MTRRNRSFCRRDVIRLGASGARLALLSSACGLPRSSAAPKVPRIGFLAAIPRESDPELTDDFVEGLRDVGYVERQSIAIEWRFAAAGEQARLPKLAAKLVRLRVEVIVSVATLASQAAKQATDTIPTVGVAVGEPLQAGLVT